MGVFGYLPSIYKLLQIIKKKTCKGGAAPRRLNNGSYIIIHDRLKWLRTTLRLTRGEVSASIGIPEHCITDRERGIMTLNYNEFGLYGTYYDLKWQEKFNPPPFPRFHGAQVKEVSPEWILFGVNKSSAVKEVFIHELFKVQKKMTEDFIKTGEIINGN